MQRRRRALVAAAAPFSLLIAFGARADEALRGLDTPSPSPSPLG